MTPSDINGLWLAGEFYQKGVSYEVSTMTFVYSKLVDFVAMTNMGFSKDDIHKDIRLKNIATATKLSDLGDVVSAGESFTTTFIPDNNLKEIKFTTYGYIPLIKLKNIVGKVFYIAVIRIYITEGDGLGTRNIIGIIDKI